MKAQIEDDNNTLLFNCTSTVKLLQDPQVAQYFSHPWQHIISTEPSHLNVSRRRPIHFGILEMIRLEKPRNMKTSPSKSESSSEGVLSDKTLWCFSRIVKEIFKFLYWRCCKFCNIHNNSSYWTSSNTKSITWWIFYEVYYYFSKQHVVWRNNMLFHSIFFKI